MIHMYKRSARILLRSGGCNILRVGVGTGSDYNFPHKSHTEYTYTRYSLYYKKKKHSSCEIEHFVETHLRKHACDTPIARITHM